MTSVSLIQFLCTRFFVNDKVKQINLSPAAAENKLRGWCAYQERSQHEVRSKLHSCGIYGEDAENIIARLIGENYLNEERFAVAFAGGKFRIKQWGRIKIKLALKKHRISEHCLNKALSAIPEEDYERAIEHLIAKKMKSLLLKDKRTRYHSTLNYAVSHGFEADRVRERLNVILGENSEYEFRS
jgi:regulatory protein